VYDCDYWLLDGFRPHHRVLPGRARLARRGNGEIRYWPNLGYGRFGTKVTMDHAPWFDVPDQFDPKRIRLADVEGTGTTDIIYLRRNGVRYTWPMLAKVYSCAVIGLEVRHWATKYL